MSERMDKLAAHTAYLGGPALRAWPARPGERLRPGKGGGGGDGGARQMEEDRQARVRASIDQINAIFNGNSRPFGVNPAKEFDANKTYYTADGKPYTLPTLPINNRSTGFRSATERNTNSEMPPHDWVESIGDRGLQSAATASSVKGGGSTYGGLFDRDVIMNDLRQGKLYEGVGYTQAQDRNQMYEEQRQAVTALNNRDVNRQFEDASRANRFGLARAGLSGGAADIDSAAELVRRQNEGLIQASGIGDTAAADLRNQDERTRQNLISMAQSGIDTGQAAQMALAGLDANAKSAAGARSAATVNRLFDDLSNAYLYRQQMQGMQQGMAAYRNQQQHGANNIRSGGYQGQVN